MYDYLRSNQDTPVGRTISVIAIVLGLSILSVANAEVYRSEVGGRVTYGDSLPVDAAGGGHSVLNSRGVVLKQVKSREERRAELLKEKEEKAARLRDKTLLRTFTEEEDLLRTRDDRLGLIDGQIGRLDERIRISKESLGSIIQRIQSAENANGEGNASPGLYAEQDDARKKISNTWDMIDVKAAERKELASQFEADLERYRWLKSGAGSGY